MKIKESALFDNTSTDSLKDRRLVNGKTTNLLYLGNSKYKWANQVITMMLANIWSPNKADISADINNYRNLDPQIKESFNYIISFLTFLDSLQTSNLPNISNYITAPEVKLALSYQVGQEALHTTSYALILDTIMNKLERERVCYLWKTSKLLLRRNNFISNIYQSFILKKNLKNFFRVLIANYILEGIYFYNGFAFFYKLAEKNLISKIIDQIKYINRDELVHLLLFENLIKDFIKENGWVIEKKEIVKMFEEAVFHEKEWCSFVFKDNILGINQNNINSFTKFLCNKRLERIGLKSLYFNIKNPYKYLMFLGDTKGSGSLKSNFFEVLVTNYNVSSSIEGWEKI